MSETQPTSREERQAAAAAQREEQKRLAEEQEAQREQQRQQALRGLETDLLTTATRGVQQGGLDWSTIADALERTTAAAKALAGKK